MHYAAITQKCLIILAVLHSTADAASRNSSGQQHSTKKSRCLNPPRTARRVETFIQECQDEVKNKLIGEAYQMMKDEMHKLHPTLDANDDGMQFIPDDLDAEATTAPDSMASAAAAPPTSEEAAAAETNHFYSYTLVRDQLSDAPEPRAQYVLQRAHRRAARLMQRSRRIEPATTTVYHPTLVPYEDKRIAGCLLHCVYARNNAIDKLGWPTLDGLVDFYSEGVNEHGFFMATLRSVNLCLRAVTIKYRVNRRKLPERGESCDLAFDVFDCISDQITGYCLDQYK